VSAGQRFVYGSWLLVACAGLMVAGGTLWASVHTSHHTTVGATVLCVVVANSAGPPVPNPPCSPASGFSDTVTTTTTTPNHAPAWAAFIAGAAAGLSGAVLIRSAILRGWWAAQARTRQFQVEMWAATVALLCAVAIALDVHAAAIQTALACAVAVALGESILARTRRSS
jgi:hypothetical protein